MMNLLDNYCNFVTCYIIVFFTSFGKKEKTLQWNNYDGFSMQLHRQWLVGAFSACELQKSKYRWQSEDLAVNQ